MTKRKTENDYCKDITILYIKNSSLFSKIDLQVVNKIIYLTSKAFFPTIKIYEDLLPKF